MTKSMTHLDVEDVLSSIRRLVADGPASPKKDGDGQPLFVLTPAFRVISDDAPPVPEPVADIPEPALDMSLQAADLTLASDIAEAQGDATGPLVNEEIVQPAAVERLEPILLTERVTTEQDEPDLHDVGIPDPVDSLEPGETDRHLLETRIAELERAVGRVEDEWEPDGSEPQEQHQPKLQFLKRYKDRFEVIDGDGVDIDDPALSDVRRDDQPSTHWPETSQSGPAPDNTVTFSHTPRPGDLAPSDLPEEEPTLAPSMDIVERQDDFFVDEEVLRSMVSDIVRQELQGRLGERITRNVRRMVRHEIEKALSLKALE